MRYHYHLQTLVRSLFLLPLSYPSVSNYGMLQGTELFKMYAIENLMPGSYVILSNLRIAFTALLSRVGIILVFIILSCTPHHLPCIDIFKEEVI
jgi:hypothetical protein